MIVRKQHGTSASRLLRILAALVLAIGGLQGARTAGVSILPSMSTTTAGARDEGGSLHACGLGVVIDDDDGTAGGAVVGVLPDAPAWITLARSHRVEIRTHESVAAWLRASALVRGPPASLLS